MTDNNKAFNIVAKAVCTSINKKIMNIPTEIKDNLQEIRLRVNRPLALCCPENTYFMTENGCVTNTFLDQQMLTVSSRDIFETFNNICNYSVYSKQNEIKNGFVTLKGGHRAGICGTAVAEKGVITNIRDISSINIRISVEHKNCAKPIIEKIKDFRGGLLLCGAPCSGKTTILRDLARVLSTEYKQKTALIDERSELAGTYRGVYQNDIGMCDVLDGYSKTEGFTHALRSLSPDIIICDELGNADDVHSVENAINSGVSIIASAHCSNENELMAKPQLKRLIQSKAFGNIVFLDNRKNVGQARKVMNINELIP